MALPHLSSMYYVRFVSACVLTGEVEATVEDPEGALDSRLIVVLV